MSYHKVMFYDIVKPDDNVKPATVTPKSPVEAPVASQVKTNDFKTSDDVVKKTGSVPFVEEKPTIKKVTKNEAKPAVKKVEKATVVKNAEEKETATPKKIATKKKESSKKMARRGIKLKKDLD